LCMAEELVQSAPSDLQARLMNMALLPSLSRDALRKALGDQAEITLQDAVERGFVTTSGDAPELHPLARDFLLSKIQSDPAAQADVAQAFESAVTEQYWDHAFELIVRFDRAELLELLIERGFKQLIERGR